MRQSFGVSTPAGRCWLTTWRRLIHFDLSDQANSATLDHAAAVNPLIQDQREGIVKFETGLFTAQSTHNATGVLNTRDGAGGPMALSRQPFYIGINDVLSAGFNPRAFTLFDAWRNLAGSAHDAPRRRRTPRHVHDLSRHAERRQSLERHCRSTSA